MTPRAWSRNRARKRTESLLFNSAVRHFAKHALPLHRDEAHFSDEVEIFSDFVKRKNNSYNFDDSSIVRTTLLQAGITNFPLTLCLITTFAVFCLALLGFILFHFWGLLLIPFGATPSFLIVRQKRRKRAANFAADYPAFLLAASSSLKAGRTVFDAFSRATRLLPESSIMRQEIDILLEALTAGTSRESALANFGTSVALPDIELFRQACLLALEHGGSFSSVLQRLARVTSDRATLINAAKVSTASMRLTANILLVLTPAFIGLVAVRTDNFIGTLTSNHTATLLMSIGLGIVLVGFMTLREMSEFTP